MFTVEAELSGDDYTGVTASLAIAVSEYTIYTGLQLLRAALVARTAHEIFKAFVPPSQ